VDVTRPHRDHALDDIRGVADKKGVLHHDAEMGHLSVRLLDGYLGRGGILGWRQVALGNDHEPQTARSASLAMGILQLDRLRIGDNHGELPGRALEKRDWPPGPDVARDLAGECSKAC
jgi:hypothetical protein